MRFLTTKISRKRRSRFAGPAVLLAALVMTGGLYAALAPANADTNNASSADVARGQALFQVGCSSCHGQNGQGITTTGGGVYGPSLVGVGGAAAEFQLSTGRMPLEQPGQQALRKRPVYTPQDIQDLVAYVASLGPGPSVPSADDVDLSKADVAQGGQFFRTNCTACHNFAGAGGAMPEGKFAPKITADTPTQIFEAMETGPQQMPIFSNSVLTPAQKRDIIAYVKTLSSAPQYGGFSLGSIGPVAEGAAAWIFGIGGLVLVAIWIAAHTARSKKKVDA